METGDWSGPVAGVDEVGVRIRVSFVSCAGCRIMRMRISPSINFPLFNAYTRVKSVTNGTVTITPGIILKKFNID